MEPKNSPLDSVMPPQATPYEQNARAAIVANPRLAQEPATVHAIASTPGVDGTTLGLMTKQADTLSGVRDAVLGHATSNRDANQYWSDATNIAHTFANAATDQPKPQQGGRGILGDIGNFFTNTLNNIAQYNPVMAADTPESQRSWEGQASLAGTEAVAKGALNFANRTVWTAAELGTGGFVGENGIGQFSANLGDAQQTFLNAINIPKTWDIGKQALAYTESMANQKGLGYTLVYLMPAILTALAGNEVVAGGGETSDLETLANLALKAQKTGKASSTDFSRFIATASRVARKFNPDTVPEDTAAANLEEAVTKGEETPTEQLGKTDKLTRNGQAFKAARDFFQPVARWTIGPFAKGAKAYLGAVNNPRFIWSYAMMQQQAMQNPYTAALWKASANGVPVDSRGMPIHMSPGGYLADSLGLEQGSLGYTLVSGAVDMGTFMSSDPIGAASHYLDAANSAHGVGGVLGKWWPGLGVETGADVFEKAGSTARNRRAFQYMVDHGYDDIKKMFNGMYTDSVLHALANAKTWDEVVGIHADIADGGALTGYVLPTTRVFRVGTRAIGKGITRIVDAGLNVFGRTVLNTDLMKAVDIMNEELAKAGLDEIDLLNIDTAGTNDVRRLARGSLNQRLRALATESIWKIDEAEAKGEIPKIANYAFKLGDKDAIPLIQRMFLQTGQFNERIIQALGDVLRTAKSNVEFGNALVHLSTLTVSGQLGRMVGENYYALKDYFEPMIRQDFENLYGFRGGGAFKDARVYNAGPDGLAMSTFVDPEDPASIGLYGNAFQHIRAGHFIDPRQIAGMLSRYAKAAATTDSTLLFKASEARNMEEQAMARIADIQNAVVQDARKTMADIVEKRTNSYLKKGLIGLAQGYRDGFEKVVRAADRAMNNPELSEPQKFVQYAKSVSRSAYTAAKSYKDMVEQADAYNALKEAADNATKINAPEASRLRAQLSAMTFIPEADLSRAKGTLQALMDMEARIYKKISTPAVPIKDFQQLAKTVKLADSKKANSEAQKLLVEKMSRFRATQINYLRWHNKTADAFNWALSNMFIPEMLSTGAYLIRVSASEALLNISRIGPVDYFESRLAASIAKHEEKYMPLAEVPNPFAKALLPDTPPVIKESELLSKETMRIANILMDGGSWAKSLYMGSLTGIERGILQAMNPERFERMLSDYATALSLCGGHIADITHGINQIYGTTKEAAAMSQMAYGTDEEGGKVVSGTRFVGDGYTKADKKHIASALFNQLQLIHGEKDLYLPIAKDIEAMVAADGKYTYSGLGRRSAFDNLVDKQVNRLLQIPEDQLQGFGAYGKLLAENSSGDPLRDFATTQVYNVWHSLSGLRSTMDEGTEAIFHQDLIDQAVSGNIKAEPDLAKDYTKAKGLYPMHLIAASDARSSWETDGIKKYLKVLAMLPKITNEAIIDRAFGNIVSWMSREPVFLWEYHASMEQLRERIADNLMTEEQASVQALNNAFTRMVRYVHNPADRFQFEQATRILSPFWFAKNQAYRRAFRLLDDDPAAFVRYLRICMRMTQVFHKITQNNQSYLGMPGGSEVTHFAVNALASGNNLLGNFFTNLGFTMLGDPSAIQTIDPLGSDTGVKMIENLLRPDASPYVSVLTKMVMNGLADNHIIDAQAHANVLAAILGPVGAKTGILSDLLPSSFWRDTAFYAVDTAGYAFNHKQFDLGNVAQTQVTAMHEALQNMLTTYIDEYFAMNNIKTPSNTDNVNAQNYALEQASAWFNEGTNEQQFIERAYVASLALSVARLLPSFFSPIAPVLKANFSNDKFNQFASLKMPNGEQIPFSEAQYLFAQQYPQEWVDTISSSQNPFGSYPETNVTYKWINAVPKLLEPDTGYPNLFAYGIPRSGTYLPGIYQNLVSMGLRSRDTPQDFINTFLANAGDQFYYGQLVPQYYAQYGGTYYGESDPRNYIPYAGTQALKAAAQSWGNTNNPTWLQYGSPFGTSSKPKEVKAVEQLKAFLADPEAQAQVTNAGLWTKGNIAVLSKAFEQYNNYMEQIDQPGVSAKEQWSVEQELQNTMDAYAQDPANANIAYLLTAVLAKAPTK